MESDEEKRDVYYTVKEKQRAEIKIKKSKFIATVMPASSTEIAKESLGTIRTEFFDASHNCFAYRIGPDGMEFRASDDAEPNGSAGKPILFEIKKHELSDLIVIVTRFFGGTRLGIGNLARAYSEATNEVLSKCEKKAVHLTRPIKVFCTYEDINIVKKIVVEISVSFTENYHDAVEIIANIPLSKVKNFVFLITENTAGRAGTVNQ